MGNILGYGENTAQNSGNPPNQSELNSTPVRKGMTVCDPRSPAQFHRTPVVVKDSVKVIEDPRSPISSVNRTPIGKKPIREETPLGKNHKEQPIRTKTH